MALNPTLIQGNEYLFPANKGSEFTYLRRNDVKLKLYLPDRTIKEDGTIFLTSTRLVFVKRKQSKTNFNFEGLELPLNLIEKPKFEQPVFGLNYLSGMVKPLIDHPNSLKTTCKWNIVFLNGQCNSFLNYFFKVYEASKKSKPLGTLSEFNEQFFSISNAYVDPNDPTFLYLNEPVSGNIYKPQNLSHDHYIPINNANNGPITQSLNTPNEDSTIHKTSYIPQNNQPNNIMSYNQQNYIANYDPTNNRTSYNQQTYLPNNYEHQNNIHTYNQPNVNLPNYDQQNNNMYHYNQQKINLVNYDQQNNNFCHYNQQDNRVLYNHQDNIHHYNQQNALLNYDNLNNRNLHNKQNNIPDHSYNKKNNITEYNQRMNHLHNQQNNQQNNQQFNPAYNQQFNNVYNQSCNVPPYNQQLNDQQQQQKNNSYNQLYSKPHNQPYNG